MAKKFTTDKKYYKQKNGKREQISVYNGITLDEMIDWLIENGTDEEKKAFKTALYSYKDGEPMPFDTKAGTGERYQKTNFINAKRHFFKAFAPDLLPVKKVEEEKPPVSERMKDW